MSEYILEMSEISKSFFGIKVLNDAKLQVKPGEVHVLIGENGAGKSTLIKILSGAYRRESGEIVLNDKKLGMYTPKDALDMGISVIYQEFNLSPFQTVYENIFLGKEFVKRGLIDKKTAISKSQNLMDLIGLNVKPSTLVSKLSVAQKQMVEIIKAISNDAKIIVMDEPTASITEKETEKLFDIVRNLKQKGIGIIYISHRMSELFEIGDRCTVMRDGEYVATMNLSDTNESQLIKMMVGRNVSFSKMENKGIEKDKVALEVKNICYRNLLKNISFDLKKGEILGISGLVGAGRTELAKCIIGMYKTSKGEIFLNGEKVIIDSIPKAMDKGIVYLSEDRKDEGIVLAHSVMDNIVLPNLSLFGRLFLSKRKMINTSKEYIKKLKIKTPSYLSEANNLSGGNQQKLVVAKWLCFNANFYIFDEPTRGIDVGAREEIYKIMQDLTVNGASIIMISSDLVEVLKICDRIVVMKEGEITAILDNNKDLTQETILSYASNGGSKDE